MRWEEMYREIEGEIEDRKRNEDMKKQNERMQRGKKEYTIASQRDI